jgi:fructose-bisphosphate aldolase class II
VNAAAWSAEVIAAAAVDAPWLADAPFAECVVSGTVVGTVSAEVAERLGLPRATALVAGAHDQAASFIGAGGAAGSVSAFALGSSDCLTVETPQRPGRIADTGFATYPWQPARWLTLAGTAAGGWTLEWYAGLTGVPDVNALLSESSAEPPPILVLPYLAGSGTLDNDPTGRGAVIGLTLDLSRPQLTRAFLEAAGYELGSIVAAFAAADVPVGQVRAVGTGAVSLDDEPNDFDSNVAITTSVVDVAHSRGVSVEGELGTIGGAEAGITGIPEEIVYADPAQAEEFVARTGVDALAVAVGTSHGSVKFTDESGGQRLRINLIADIKKRLPRTALVLHGSSSIPLDAVAAINKQGGSVTRSYGIDAAQKQAGISQGIRKINQGTDSHLAWTAALRTALSEDPSEVEPSSAIAAGMAAMTAIVRERMREFGSAGQTT